jgi:ABC-2 type transport system permease protein
MFHSIVNITRLGIKELWSLWRDRMMLFLTIYIFSLAIYVAGTAMPETIHQAPIAIVDEDRSALSSRIAQAFYPPQFIPPKIINLSEQDPGLDAGDYTFTLDIPPNFQRDVLAGRSPAIQVNVDATRMSQAFIGSGYIHQIVLSEIHEFVSHQRESMIPGGDLAVRIRFNPSLNPSWFGSLMELVNHLTMLAIILTGAAVIREREHGTVEHLLVMPVSLTEIMLSKVWSMSAAVIFALWLSLTFVVQGLLHVPVEGSIGLFLIGSSLHLFATSSLGIFMATTVRNMPQFGMLMILILMPLQMLSGGMTPFESMPFAVRLLMSLSPTTHYTELSQAILFRGAGWETVWIPFLKLILIGLALFFFSLIRFRKSMMRLT